MDRLTVLYRMYGKGDPKSFMSNLRQALADLELQFVLCTNEGDPLGEIAMAEGALVVRADMKRFDVPVNTLLLEADRLFREGKYPERAKHSLFISPGVVITGKHVFDAMELMNRAGLYMYGWQIQDQFNDGSGPGRLIYNTCALYDNYGLFKHAGQLPEYVNNGVLGDLEVEIDGQMRKGPIGGGEETIQMLEVLNYGNIWDENGNTEPYAPGVKLFAFNATTTLPMPAKTSTGNIGFDWKIARKGPVATQIYLPRFGYTTERFMSHVQVF